MTYTVDIDGDATANATPLAAVKLALRVTGTDADDELNRLLCAAAAEFVKFTNADIDDPVTTPELAADAFNGVVLMVQADFDADPTQRATLRRVAEALWYPYRAELGF